jgi:hypothetical protein
VSVYSIGQFQKPIVFRIIQIDRALLFVSVVSVVSVFSAP